MRVLAVAWYYPPLQGTGVFRTLALTNVLAEQGHEVTVLAPDREYFERATPLDTALERSIHPSIDVRRVPFPDLEDPIINRWPLGRVSDRALWRKRAKDLAIKEFPEPYYGVWRDRIVGTACRLQHEAPYDAVFVTGSAYVDYVVADALHTYYGVPFLMDDRDSFMFSVYDGTRRPHATRMRRWWETLASAATEIWFVNPPIADLHRRHYPILADKIRVVENGWDLEHLDQAKILRADAQRPIFSYLGAINSGFHLGELLDSWQEASGLGLPGEAQLRIWGNFGTRNRAINVSGSPTDSLALAAIHGKLPGRLREALEAAQGVRVLGAVPKSGVTSVYEETAVLVFFKEGGSLVTSSKIYEYMATGSPIVAVIPKQHDSHRVLSGYPRAHIADLADPDSWAQAFLSAWTDAQNGDAHRQLRAQRYAAKYRRDLILDPALGDFMGAVANAMEGLESQ